MTEKPETAQSLLVRSPAKINPFLEVIGRRPDGFHDLETVMLRTNLCDVMHFTVSLDGRVQVSRAGISTALDGSDFPVDNTNLIVRAANALQQRTGTHLGAAVVVQKQIPAMAGLGGGSGNAAMTLRALNQLWDLQLTAPELHDVAASLGSDVNFLLSGCRAAICRGRGEVVEGVPLNGPVYGVLAVPSTGNSTRDVFAAVRQGRELHYPADLLGAFDEGNIYSAGKHCFNRLQQAACDINPEIQDLLDRLKSTTGTGILTGSGSACFSIVSSHRQARLAALQMADSGLSKVWAFRC